jgi:hypothetical protein
MLKNGSNPASRHTKARDRCHGLEGIGEGTLLVLVGSPALPPPAASPSLRRCHRFLPAAKPSRHSGAESSSQRAETPATPRKGTAAEDR